MTSNAGWDTRTHAAFLTEVLLRFRNAGIRTSLFIDTETDLIQGAADVGADRIELYTGPYAEGFVWTRRVPFGPLYKRQHSRKMRDLESMQGTTWTWTIWPILRATCSP